MAVMKFEKITVSDVNKKYLKIIGYLTVSGLLGYLSSTYIAKDPALTAIFALPINFILYALVTELKNEGYREALK